MGSNKRKRDLNSHLTELSNVRIPSEAIKLFSMLEERHGLVIPYKVVTRGENEGLLKVLPIRVSDHGNMERIIRLMKANGIDWIMDHQCTFRTINDEIVLMFSPYGSRGNYTKRDDDEFIGGLQIAVSDYSIHGNGTRTFVAWEE